ncbi:S-adenosyl-L-methionine-dependent methyltransferase [Hysterangium stoloniferum]|nr:S-adenosyl-L-methionine-dependent methyltransferase [Hysterangium stoloniferum]
MHVCIRTRYQLLSHMLPLYVRCYGSSSSALPSLPHVSQWIKFFDKSPRSRRHRICLANTTSATFLAKSFLEPVSTSDGKGRVVIEAYAGPGLLSRALLRWPSSTIRKLIILEEQPDYYAHLKNLESFDPRIKVFKLDGSHWDTYAELEHSQILDDVRTHDWKGKYDDYRDVSYNLNLLLSDEADIEFICHVPHSPLGDQFVTQLFRSIPEHSWLFKYGRMRMHFIMAQSLYSRISGTPPCKVSVVAEATCSSHPLAPYDAHFWPPPAPNMYKLPESRKPGQPMVAASFVPLVDQLIHPMMLDKWDYCLRRLFVTKASQLGKALPALGAGGSNLYPLLAGPDVPREERLNMETRIKDLTVSDWAKIVRVFHEWPFAPENLKLQTALFGRDRFRS